MNRTKGYYFGEYEIAMREYAGADFSRRCFIFPGQGSAFPGMFKNEYPKFKIIRERFALADKLAEKFSLPKISDYILDPDGIKKEILPAVAQLALFTLESALFDILISLKMIPRIVAGHSFGEYAALAVSGVVPFEEMFEIVYYRDHFCPPANSAGIMIAVNADAEKIALVLKNKEYYISNFNSSDQTVISVPKNGVDETSRVLDGEKIRYKVLYNVSQPYHSPYLNGARKKLEQYFKNRKFSFKKPEIPIFSSVLGKLINKDNFKEEDIKNILLNQITTPVNFINQIQTIYSLGCFNFLELGGKKLFSVFIEDILAGKEVKTELASDLLRNGAKEVVRSLNPQNSKIFALISKVIGKITGYEIEKISFEDRFQEDLGIDSIKKADILLTVLNESNIDPGEDFNTSEFVSVKDAVSYLERAEKRTLTKSAKAVKETKFKRYIFEPVEMPLKNYPWSEKQKNQAIILDIADIIKDKGAVLKEITLFFKEKKNITSRQNVVLRAGSSELDFDKILFIFRFFREFINAIDRDDFNAILVSAGGKIDPSAQCFASFLKSLKKELPGMFFKHIHFDEIKSEKELLDVAVEEALDSSAIDVLYRGGKRFSFAPKLAGSAGQPVLDENSVILAIGGAKGITFSLVKNISQKYKPIIYLAGKSPKENEIVRVNMAELKKENSKIYYESLDARDMKSIEELFSKIIKKHKKIDLVINGAGAVKIGFLKAKTDEDMNYEFSNKVLPASNVLKLALKYKPKRVINFSSIISKYGSAGQTIYTSANALVSGLTEDANSVLKRSGSSAVTVHFPPWDEVGMTGDRGVLQKLKEYGVSLLKPAKADELFAPDISSSAGAPVYYLDDSDDMFYGFPLNNLKQYEPLIGALSDPFGISMSRPVFEKTFDLSKDIYLKDHKIEGASYVPAAVGIGMFLCLGNMYFKKFPILKNIVIQNPIVVKSEPVKCFLEAESKNGSYGFSIKSNAPHFSGAVEDIGTKKASRYDLPKADQEIARSSIYSDYYFKDSLYLGPIFQSINKAFVDKDGNPFIAIDNSKLLPVLGLGFYDKLIQWIDASFQALGAVALKQNLKMIPVKVLELSVFSGTEVSNIVYALPSAVKFIDNGMEGNVALVNEKGEAIIKMSGVFIKKIGEYGKSGLEIKKYKDE